MAVESSLNKHTYNGNGATTQWPYSFKIFQASDIQVVITDEDGIDAVIENGYKVSEYDNTVIYPYPSGPALPIGRKITLNRILPLLQGTVLPNQGPFHAKTIEQSLDRSTMIDQQQQEQIDRTLKLPISTGVEVSKELPGPVPNKLLGWDSTGTKIVNTHFNAADIVGSAETMAKEAQNLSAKANSIVDQTRILDGGDASSTYVLTLFDGGGADE